MLSKFFEALYNKVLVNIVLEESTTIVYIELYSKKGIIQESHEHFNTLSINEKMYDFIATYIKESPYYYISILDNSQEQGAIPTCQKQDLAYYYDLSTSEYKCNDSKWSYYTSKADLNEMEKVYSDIGIDMVFSPFSILSHFFKDKIQSHLAMYILVQENSLSLSVFEESKLLYADYIHMSKSIEEPSLSDGMDDGIAMDFEEEGIDLDDIDVDDGIEDIDELDDLEDFADIEDLDSIEDIDEFAKADDLEEELAEVEVTSVEPQEGNFDGDYERFSFIKTSIGAYYSDEHYESKFIETVYIADAIGVSSDLKHYLEEEMFLKVYIRRIELGIAVAELAKMEINL